MTDTNAFHRIYFGKKTQAMILDRTDFGILRLLQNDASLSNKEIAAAINLAPSSAHERLRRLRQEGVLRGSHADVAPKAMGVGLEALLFVETSKHDRDLVDHFLDEIVEVPEVRFAFLVTGPHDFIVHVVARDMAHLKNLVLDRFTNRPAVTRIETSIIYEARVRHELPHLGDPL